MENYYTKNHHQQQQQFSPSNKTLEITVLSGEDLRINNRSIPRNAFVTVRSDKYDHRTTAVDTEGGSYPQWNEKFALDFGAKAATLIVEVHCKTAFGTKTVGTASVPVSDFSGGYVPETYLHFLSYRLRDSRGQRNGIINISVRTKGSPPRAEEKYTCSTSSSTTVGLAVGNNYYYSDSKSNNNNNFAGAGIVTGIPIWNNNSYQRRFCVEN